MHHKYYVVRVNDPPAIYKPGYFPREFGVKRHAIEAAQQAIRNGATLARVEFPNGGGIEFRPSTTQQTKGA